MKTFIYPEKNNWETLIARAQKDRSTITEQIQNIIEQVQQNGDQAIRSLTSQLDKVDIDEIQCSKNEIETAALTVDKQLQKAIDTAYSNIYTFHKSQTIRERVVETMPGVECWLSSKAIDKVGLYIPGGTAPLFSTVLMLGIPAKIAACKEIIICTPPQKNGKIHNAILYCAQKLGIEKIYKIGGAQAIAAMAYGTETVPAVHKIFGPGNQYVTKAKELVSLNGVAIDMPAGPSELLVIADETSVPAFVAADLLSQAEHGPDSQVILLSNNPKVIEDCLTELDTQIELLPRKSIAIQALSNSKAICLKSKVKCIEFSNRYAPEHLIIASENADSYIENICNAGSVFLGNFSCESAGDYASGTNHTLPTNGYARNYSGVSVDSFVKKISFQKISKTGIQNIGETIEIMAEAEQLFAHKNAVSIRLNNIK